jgi:hypothetical protein
MASMDADSSPPTEPAPAPENPGVRGNVRRRRKRPAVPAGETPAPDPGEETRPVDQPAGLSTQSIRDQRLAARALREGRHISQDMRDELLAHQYKIATAKRGKARDKSRAFVAIVGADRAASQQVAIQFNQQVAASRLEADTGAELLPGQPIDQPAAAPRVVLYLPDNGRHL